ncbi:hypothetical protein HD842_004259 [Massilia aurea]|uniref:Uncharacterized protein n=1 Tax=Massilia aurea TaxID=373040 RepID=A0A7W9X3X9_9BURK|nr:hypothetical protein [Massilia aurea]MBB6136082.1 hypothetical protein [Massilia aurea]
MLRAYAYVDGSDLDEIGDQLAEVFANFLPTWGISSARLVNDKSPRTPDLHGDDLPDWNLGLNFETERLSLAEFNQLILFLSRTAEQTQREFVIGGYGPSSRFAEDWGYIGTHVERPELQSLQDILVGPQR